MSYPYHKQNRDFLSQIKEDASYAAEPIRDRFVSSFAEADVPDTDTASAQSLPRGTSRAAQRKPKKKAMNVVYGAVCVVCLAVLIFSGYILLPQLRGIVWKGLDSYAFVGGNIIKYDAEKLAELKRSKSYMDRDTIFPGVYIDQMHVGDMTIEQAKQLLSNTEQGMRKSFSVDVVIGDGRWHIDSSMVKIQRNIGNVVEQAYAYGRSNSAVLSGTSLTPLQERFDSALFYRTEGKSLYTEWTYDTKAVRRFVEEIAAYIRRDPIDAQIAEFDFDSRSFTFTDDQPGLRINADELYEKVIEKIDKWEQNAVVTMEPTVTLAKVRKHDMMNSFKMIAAYTTSTKGSKERLSNIDLACKSINGYVLMPGDTFSFNEVVGQRTIEKGYREAGTIMRGQLVPDVGGGICQVSTTLFNAVTRADLEIVKRNNHAWPISYINIGEDAAVNWPGLDLKFKNNKDTPVFIIMYYNSKSTSCEVFGMSLGEGVSIDLESHVVQQLAPPAGPEYVYNAALPYGTQKQTVQARTGYQVETFKVWKKNGQETRREKLHNTTYKAYQEKIEYNADSAPSY